MQNSLPRTGGMEGSEQNRLSFVVSPVQSATVRATVRAAASATSPCVRTDVRARAHAQAIEARMIEPGASLQLQQHVRAEHRLRPALCAHDAAHDSEPHLRTDMCTCVCIGVCIGMRMGMHGHGHVQKYIPTCVDTCPQMCMGHICSFTPTMSRRTAMFSLKRSQKAGSRFGGLEGPLLVEERASVAHATFLPPFHAAFRDTRRYRRWLA